MKKNWLIVGVFIFSFFIFLSSQIAWEIFTVNADQAKLDDNKIPIYESLFHEIDFTTTLKNKVKLSSRPEPILILNFWASWCTPCLKEFPSLVKLKEKYQDKIFILGVNGDEENAEFEIKKIEKKFQLNFESVVDSTSTISNKFMVNSYPVSLFYHKGKIFYVSKKTHDFMDEKFIKLIDETLKK